MGDEDYLEDFIPRASVIPKGVLSEEQEGALAEIIEEDKTEIVEDIVEFFVHWPQVRYPWTTLQLSRSLLETVF